MYPDRLPFIDKIVEDRFRQLVDAVVKGLIDQTPAGGGLSGDPSLDYWEEYKDQVQSSPSIFFDHYEDLIYELSSVELKTLTSTEHRLLWLWCDRYELWDEESDPDYWDVDLKQELFSRVKGRAMNEPLKNADDDESKEEEETSYPVDGPLHKVKGFATRLIELLMDHPSVTEEQLPLLSRQLNAVEMAPTFLNDVHIVTILHCAAETGWPIMWRIQIRPDQFLLEKTYKLFPENEPSRIFLYSINSYRAEEFRCGAPQHSPDKESAQTFIDIARYLDIQDVLHDRRFAAVMESKRDRGEPGQPTLFNN